MTVRALSIVLIAIYANIVNVAKIVVNANIATNVLTVSNVINVLKLKIKYLCLKMNN